MQQFQMFKNGKTPAVFIAGFALCLILTATPLAPWGIFALYFAGPCMLAYALLEAGLIPCMLCTGMACFSWGIFGTAGAAAGAVYYLPGIILYMVLAGGKKGLSFPRSALCLTLQMILCQVSIYAWMQLRYEGKAMEAAADALCNVIRSEEWGDTFLAMLNSYGLLDLRVSAANGYSIQNGLYVLSDAVREDLLSSLGLYIIALLEALTPACLIGHSVYSGVLTASFPILSARSRRERLAEMRQRDPGWLPDGEVPPLSMWFLPRGWGWRIGIFALGFALAQMQDETVRVFGQILYQIFSSVYLIQGIAALNYFQNRRGARKIWRVLIPILILITVSDVLTIFGAADQILDPRMLRREKTDPNNHHKEEDV